MAVSFVAGEVSDLCIGKPALGWVPPSATVREALLFLKRCGENHLTVWRERYTATATPADGAAGAASRCLGKVCVVDIICYLCAEENLTAPSAALESPVSVLLRKDSGALIRNVERHCSVLEALDVILGGAQNLMVPLRGPGAGRSKVQKNALGFCWITQEDFVRFFLNSIGAFSPIPAFSIESLGIIQSDVLVVEYHKPALSAMPLIKQALASQTAVAVVTDDGKLIGEISPTTLANCDETVATAIATLSAGDLMAYIDSGGPAGPPEEAIRAVKARLAERGMVGMLELMEEVPTSDASSSSSSDEESPPPARYGRSGSYSARMGRRSEDAIVCHPWSSLVAVMIQALAHRVTYVWVVGEDYQLAGVVTFAGILTVFRDELQPSEQRQ
ncbi:unnamed protein product [Spirodela intermedia]|uniref:Uncharacterized protein n=2 Tax=Spirodela intermedia TaxID=51605 RepID=A0A7I8K3N9_SPIIN|nr:unnamed protein product [Spirodela intermedia]CAA6655672.1 unnamed protein product [Spirodela intermedia]CAA7391005.1 unnamed protein product [Spirodela intermedia]